MMNSTSGMLRSIGGSSAGGFSGDEGLGVLSTLNFPTGVSTNRAGTIIYFSDTLNERVRKLSKDLCLPGYFSPIGKAIMHDLDQNRKVYTCYPCPPNSRNISDSYGAKTCYCEKGYSCSSIV